MARLLAACCLIFLGAVFSAFSVHADLYKYHPSNTLHLGSSFNPIQPYRAYNSCVVYTSVLPSQGPKTAISTEFNSSLVNTREELYHHLNIDATLSASYLFASGSASFSLDNEYKFSSHDLVWVVKGVSDYGRFTMSDPQLSPEAAALKANPVAFAERCGYEFVAQEHRVVQVVAVYSLHDLTEEERTHIKASLSASASFDAGGFSVSAKLDEYKRAFKNMTQVKVDVFALGGNGITLLASLSGEDHIDDVRKVIGKYMESMGPEAAAPIEYVTGSWRTFGVDVDPAALKQRSVILSELYFNYLQYEPVLRKAGQLVRESNVPGTWMTPTQVKQASDKYLAVGELLDHFSAVANVCLDDSDINRQKWIKLPKPFVQRERIASLLNREETKDLKCELEAPPTLSTLLPEPPVNDTEYKITEDIYMCAVPRDQWVGQGPKIGEKHLVGITCDLPGDYIPRPDAPNLPQVDTPPTKTWQGAGCPYADRYADLDLVISPTRLNLRVATNSSDSCIAKFNIHYYKKTCIKNCPGNSSPSSPVSQTPSTPPTPPTRPAASAMARSVISNRSKVHPTLNKP